MSPPPSNLEEIFDTPRTRIPCCAEVIVEHPFLCYDEMSHEDTGSALHRDASNQTLDTQAAASFQLIPLKTTLETRAGENLIDVYITAVPEKQASGALDVIRKLIPNDGGLDLQHLRRFAKYDFLPENVRAVMSASQSATHTADKPVSRDLFLMIGPTNAIPKQTLVGALSATVANLTVYTMRVPLVAPTSQAQASLWTDRYWPTIFKKSNPFGPHPSIVSRAEDEMGKYVGKYMDLAAEVAEQSRIKGYGEEVGVVIVERRGGVARVMATAGDARRYGWPRGGPGNVTAHATLRAIAMIAEGLKSRDASSSSHTPLQHFFSATSTKTNAEIFQDAPLLPIEAENYDTSDNTNGYLCHELEIYCTHEPCVMCSMAIVHSRFGRVVFEKRMPRTGGLCADGEGGLGHGLFWRKELNWTLLAWQFVRLGGEAKETYLTTKEDLNT